MKCVVVGVVCFGFGWTAHRTAFWLHIWKFHKRYHLHRR